MLHNFLFFSPIFILTYVPSLFPPTIFPTPILFSFSLSSHFHCTSSSLPSHFLSHILRKLIIKFIPAPPKQTAGGIVGGEVGSSGGWGKIGTVKREEICAHCPKINFLVTVDRYFMLVHNILPLRGRLAGFGLEAGTCGHCGGLEDMQHFFQRFPLVSDSWERLYFRLVSLQPGLPSDLELIMLAFPVATGASLQAKPSQPAPQGQDVVHQHKVPVHCY